MLLVNIMVWSPVVQVFILAFGTLASFVVALSKGHVNKYLPFVSETGAYSPEMCIFSLVLYLGSFVGFCIVGIRFLLVAHYNEDRIILRINNISFIIGSAAMLGLAGVAAFPMTTVFWAHLVAAALYFCGSALYFACSTLMTWKTEGPSKKFICRCILTVLLLVLLFILMICFPISLHNWQEFNTIKPALKEPENKGFGMVLFCSILEWSVVFIIVLFTLTFVIEMKNHGLLLTVTPIKTETSSLVTGHSGVTEPRTSERGVPEPQISEVRSIETPI